MSVYFSGRKYGDRGDGYYVCGRRYLHRDRWSKEYGEIPEGCVIHHIDHDPSNNDISNLELMTETQHLKYHANHPDGVADRARKWRRENKQHDHVCTVCGKAYTSIFPEGPHAKYCSTDCLQVQYRRNQRAKEGREPIVEFTAGEKVCKYCGKTYITNHRRKSLYCSSKCKNKDRPKRN